MKPPSASSIPSKAPITTADENKILNPKSKILNSSWLPFVLQTGDSLFPTGAYAHSLGLEELVRLKIVRDEPTLRAFLQEQIIPALIQQELPYLRFARDAATRADLDELCALDAEIHAWKLCPELRRASTQLGTRRLNMLLQIAPSPLLEAIQQRLNAGEARGHQLLICGLQFATVPLPAALATYFYQSLAAYSSAALKLIRIGQDGCQRVLRDCLIGTDTALEKSLTIERDQTGAFNPLLEIGSLRHEHADERLFIS